MGKHRIKVDVVSDVVCPWCYIGKHRLDAAILQVKDEVEIEVRYLPFELNPSIPAGGTDHKQYLIAKFGAEHRYEQLTNRVATVALQEGLKFDLSKQHTMPNTLNAHRLIQLAGTTGVQGAVKEALMRAYFWEGMDLSKNSNLIDVVATAGLDRTLAETLLSTDTDVPALRELEKLNQLRGITGVPFFIINDKYGVSGAQPSEVLAQIFREVSIEVADTAGQSCEVDQPSDGHRGC